MNEMQDKLEGETAVPKKAWVKPEATSEKVKDITAASGGSGPDNSCVS